MMEKRVLLASAICIVFLSLYANLMAKMYPATKPRPVKSAPAALSAAQPSQTALQGLADEEVIILESEAIRLEIGRKSATIRAVTLKDFRGEGDNALKIASTFPLFAVRAGGEDLGWKVATEGPQEASFESKQYHISYRIESDKALVELVLAQNAGSAATPAELVSVWSKADHLDDRNNPIEASLLYQKSGGKPSYKKFHSEHKAEKNVPRGTLMAALSERYFCQVIRPASGSLNITLLPAPAGTIAMRSVLSEPPPAEGQRVSVYFGPRDFFRLSDVGMEDAFHIGVLGQIGLILLKGLSFIASLTKNYGIAVILFSIAITLLMSPFTLLGMRSMRRMQELRPHVERIMAQHKDDPTKANQQVFALYKQHKISPLSGCLPLLLQMPIFIAMFQAISHYIELRGATFLWMKDLSLPDRLAMLPFSIPFLGNEFNILPLIMAGTMYLQTKLQSGSTASASAQQDPTAKILSGPFMSILFGFMFYHFPAGLVLYWLTNNVVSIALYRLAK